MVVKCRIVVGGEGARRAREGGTIIFNKWVRKVEGSPSPGDLVEVVDDRGEIIGYGLYEEIGPTAIRMMFHYEHALDLWEALVMRFERALGKRKITKYYETGFYRLINSDGDMMPGLIVDVYNDIAVIQSSSQAFDTILESIVDALLEVLGGELAVYNKSVQRSRRDIGLPLVSGFLKGSKGGTVIREGGALFYVDVVKGQKTGFFLDQRENRIEIESLVEANSRILDIFSYTGGFGIHAFIGGGREVVFIEEDPHAINILKKNLKLNGAEGKVIEGDAWGALRNLISSGELFDVVIVDPPAFIQSKENYAKGIQAYQYIYKYSLKLLKPGGLVFLSSCSYFLGRKEFVKLIHRVLTDLGREYSFLGSIRGCAKDHTQHAPSTYLEYLKAVYAVVY